MEDKYRSTDVAEIEYLKAARKGNNKLIYIAIVSILVISAIAMTGVYYELW